VNLDIAIHRLALSQSSTLGGAQVLLAKLRNDVQLKALRDAQNQPDDATPAYSDTISDAFASVAQDAKPLALTPEAGAMIDKLA
jgi:hypothetical protein